MGFFSGLKDRFVHTISRAVQTVGHAGAAILNSGLHGVTAVPSYIMHTGAQVLQTVTSPIKKVIPRITEGPQQLFHEIESAPKLIYNNLPSFPSLPSLPSLLPGGGGSGIVSQVGSIIQTGEIAGVVLLGSLILGGVYLVGRLF